MSKLVNKLDKKRKKREAILKGDAIINDVNQLLLEAHEEDHEILEAMGLNHQVEYKKELESEVTRSRIAQERYNKESYTGQEIKELCAKYDLKILHARYYNGSIPPELTRKVKGFCDEQNLIIKDNSFWILAPVEQFNTIKHVPVNSDPILFYLDGSQESGSSYKKRIDEEDRLINVHYWGNDFSESRTFRHHWNGYMEDEEHLSNRGRTVLAIIVLAIAIGLNIGMYIPIIANIFLLAVIAFPLWWNDGYHKKYYAELWNERDV